MNNYKKIVEEFDKMDDVDQWKWAIKNKDNIRLFLDNDATFFKFKRSAITGSFNEYIGWSEGVFALLEAIGIKAEGV